MFPRLLAINLSAVSKANGDDSFGWRAGRAGSPIGRTVDRQTPAGMHQPQEGGAAVKRPKKTGNSPGARRSGLGSRVANFALWASATRPALRGSRYRPLKRRHTQITSSSASSAPTSNGIGSTIGPFAQGLFQSGLVESMARLAAQSSRARISVVGSSSG
jgi:hypothetical protein